MSEAFGRFRQEFGRASDAIPDLSPTFYKACEVLVIRGLERMREEGRYKRTWKETRLSAALIRCMQGLRRESDLQVRVDPESANYTDSMLAGTADPDRAGIVDIRLTGPWIERDIFVGVEAKIVVGYDWGTRRARESQRLYIDKGIDDFREGKYTGKKDVGLMAGYVVAGKSKCVVDGINQVLRERGRETELLQCRAERCEWQELYQSEHPRLGGVKGALVQLRHVLTEL